MSNSAQASNRVALIIGNSDYKVSPLKNPVNDALDMKKVLHQVGFDVILKTNANYEEMLLAIDEFARKLNQSQVGLFYYAGHGMQVKGDNYLIPIKAHITSETDVEYSAVNAGRVLGKMENAGNPMNIVILDACRDNPFKRSFRTSQKGLARMDAPVGSIIAYATAPGSVSADGDGRNGIYTKNLIKQISQKGLSLNDVFMEVRKGVLSDTSGKQVPWEESSLTGRFYFSMGSHPPSSTENRVKAKTVQQPKINLSTKPKPVINQPTKPSPGDIWKDPVTGMEFVWAPKGCFLMGSNSGEDDEKPVHEVCLDGFWIGKYEVTQGQWKKIMDSNPSSFKTGKDFPVEQVSWEDAKEFISKLNQKTGELFRLPTEAEWEYASRSGGKDQKCAGENDVDYVAWYNSNSGAKTHIIGTKAPNALGIYDMIGNVWEWCEDAYDKKAYSIHLLYNPLVTNNGYLRMARGGSWEEDLYIVRCTFRARIKMSKSDYRLGFRLVRTSKIVVF